MISSGAWPMWKVSPIEIAESQTTVKVERACTERWWRKKAVTSGGSGQAQAAAGAGLEPECFAADAMGVAPLVGVGVGLIPALER